jgi:hypothetical protein
MVTATLDFTPTKNQSLTLSTDHPEAVTLPAQVSVLANQRSVTFPVITKAVAATMNVTISVGVFGQGASANLVVQAAGVQALSVTPPAYKGSETMVGKVVLFGPAPSGGTVVSLTSSDPVHMVVPPQIVVPAGASQASFTLSPLLGKVKTFPTVTAEALNNQAETQTTVYTPTHTGVTLAAKTVKGGQPLVGSVNFNGNLADDSEVTLTTNLPTTVVSVPPRVTVSRTTRASNFSLTTGAVPAPTEVAITSKFPGSVTRVARFLILPPVLASLTSATSVLRAGSTAIVTVNLDAPAAATGYLVTFQNSNKLALVVPDSLIVPSGQTSATFEVKAGPVKAVASATIRANYPGGYRLFTLTIQP